MKKIFRTTSFVSLSVLSFIPTLHAGIPVWTFSAPSPARVEISAQETATVQYTITNQSKKEKDLVLRVFDGISATPCHLAGKGSTCVLNLIIDGSKIPLQGLQYTPVLCEKNNLNQCYQAGPGNELNVNLSQETAIATTVVVGQAFVGDGQSAQVQGVSYYSQDNGVSWKLASLVPAGADVYYPKAVSCNDNHLCVQIGDYSDAVPKPIVSYTSVDNGINWSAPVLTILGNALLFGLSCNNSNLCVAVGTMDSNPISYYSEDLGKTWVPSATISTLSSYEHVLNSVSCELEQCVAVGYYYPTDSLDKEVLSYYSIDGGKNWQPSTLTPSDPITEFINVSCNTNGACAAVGSFQANSSEPQKPLSYYSNNYGQSWTVSSGLPDLEASFNAVSCNTSGCAVSGALMIDNSPFIGYYSLDFGVSWLESSWPSNPEESFSASTNTIFCSETQFCTAIGGILDLAKGLIVPFSYFSNNNGQTWSNVSSWPLPENGQGGLLFAIS